MNLLRYFTDPFGLILFTLPILTIVISVILYLLIKRKLIITGIFFVAYFIMAFALFDSDFLFWCFIYTALSFITMLIVDLTIKYVKI